MNYGRKSTTAKEKELLSKSTMIRKKFTVIFAKMLLVCFVALIVVGGCAGYGIYKGIIDSAPENIDATPTGYLSTVLDIDGNETATLVASGSNRVYVTIDEIPLDLQHAFVAIEDERFYEHNGIDLTGIVRAGITGLASGHFSQGASTITQQLLKNNVFTDWTSETSFADKLERKIQEQYLAVQLEKTEDKSWILENYLNTINLGQNTLGVQAASKRYFNKDVSELNLSECAVIAGITQNPSKYNPVSNPEANSERRQKVLKNMLEQGYIDENAYNEALADNVYDRIQIVDAENSSDNINSYFVDALTEQVIQDLMEFKGYSETQAYKALYQGGLTIYSTQDPRIQQICDDEVNDEDNYGTNTRYSCSYRLTIQKSDGTYQNYSEQTMLSYYQNSNSKYNIDFDSKEDVDAAIAQYKEDIMEDGDTIVPNGETITYTLQPQASMTIIDQSTGEVKALVGGRGDKTANKTLNRATGTKRQPGSTFKILSTYAPALDTGGMTLATVQDDAPYEYSNASHTPVNNYDKSYRGFTTIRQGITYSINIVAVKTLTELGVDVGYEYLQNFGFTTLCDSDRTQALALGGITNGVTNLELTAAYATIANGGTYTKPRFYTKILDHDGNVLIDNTPQTHTVLKETTAWLLTNAMEDVLTTGTGRPAHFDGMPQAGKSGTTSSNRDALFAGYTPYYTCVVWGGYDDNAELSYTTYPKILWKSVMSRIHENLEPKDFVKPEGITTATVCKKSGKLSVAGLCDSDPRGSMVESEYFATGTVPKDYCDHHIRVTTNLATGGIADDTCPPELQSSNVYILGGNSASQDGPYILNENLANALNGITPAPTTDPNATQVQQPTADPNATQIQQPAADPNATQVQQPAADPNATQVQQPATDPNADQAQQPTDPNATPLPQE